MIVAVLTDGLADKPLGEALDFIAGLPGVDGVELGVGGYSPVPHCDPVRLLERADARRALREEIEGRGLRLCALNVSGNPLHPDASVSTRHHEHLVNALRLTELLEVDRLVLMSGCPGPGPGSAKAPHFAGGGWLPDLEDVSDWQWSAHVLPYWRERSREARAINPDLRLCFELHPGTCVYNVFSFERIAGEGDNLAVNLDPSHFFWQGIDPLAVIERLGGAVAFAHGKDTLERAENKRLNGMLDSRWPGKAEEMPWNFATVGDAHDSAWWGEFLSALRRAGHDGAVSIEWEDPFLEPEASIRRSAEVLNEALGVAA